MVGCFFSPLIVHLYAGIQYKRVKDTNFTEDVGRNWGFSQLSAESQQQINEGGFFAKMIGKKLPSQQTRSK
jgi:hypothetical protein